MKTIWRKPTTNVAQRGGTLLTVSAPVLNSDATAMIEWALNRLMHAVGNAHGRRLFVNMKATR